MHPILLALCANIFFASSSIFYTEYSRKYSATWMNFYKAFVACSGFLVLCLVFNLFTPMAGLPLLLLIGSGIAGLMIGDIFMLQAFTHLGSGRTLMIFGFQPLILGVASFYLFGQDFNFSKLVAVLFLIACVFTFSLESFRSKGHWDMKGIIAAVIAISLDASGILLTKAAFEVQVDLSAFQANFIRCAATVLGFLCLALVPRARFSPLKTYKSLTSKEKKIITLASFLGTFVALSFGLMAVQKGHLASVTALAGTSPLFATLIETLMGRKKFSPYLLFGIGFFLAGFIILVLT